MSIPLPERDWIALNAYLDGELSPAERAALESRLATEPALREELAALRETVALMGMAERQRVPRNFTLDPATYGRPARRSLLDRLGLSGFPLAAAAGTAIAVIAIGGGVILATGLARSGGANVAMEAAPLAQEAPAEAGEMITSDDMQADTAMPEAFGAAAADEVEAPAKGEMAAEEQAAEAEMAADEQAAEAEVDAAAAAAEGEAVEEEAIPEEEAAPAAAEPAEESAAEAPEAELAAPAEEPATGIGGGMGGAPSTEMAPTEVAERSAAPGEENAAAAAEAITEAPEMLMEQQATEAPTATIPATAEAATEPTTTQSARGARTSIYIGAGALLLALLLGIGLLLSLRRNTPRG